MGSGCPKCTNAQETLCELLDSDITPDRAEAIRAVIAQCPECFSRYENEVAARLLVQSCCGGAHAPDALRERIITSITRVSVTEVRYRR